MEIQRAIYTLQRIPSGKLTITTNIYKLLLRVLNPLINTNLSLDYEHYIHTYQLLALDSQYKIYLAWRCPEQRW